MIRISARFVSASALLLMCINSSFGQPPDSLPERIGGQDLSGDARKKENDVDNSNRPENLRNAASKAYDIVKKADFEHPDFDSTHEVLSRYEQYEVSEKQKEICRNLLSAMMSLRAIRTNWSTQNNGGEGIKTLQTAINARQKKVKDSADLVAKEYLAIGDLADKLQMTRQDFQNAMSQKEALKLSISALNKETLTDLGEVERNCIVGILDIVYPPRPKPDAGRNQINSTLSGASDAIGKLIDEMAQANDPKGTPESFSKWGLQLHQASVSEDSLLAEVTKTCKETVNVFDNPEKLKRILTIVDAVTTLGQPEDWTPDKKVMRVRRVAARLEFWSKYADRVAERILKSSRKGNFPLLNFPSMTNDDQKIRALAIYQQIRVSLWPVAKTEAKKKTELKVEGQYRLVAGGIYSLPSSVGPGDWLTVAIPPNATERFQIKDGNDGELKDLRVEVNGNKYNNEVKAAWKVIKFVRNGENWETLEGPEEAKFFLSKPPGPPSEASSEKANQ